MTRSRVFRLSRRAALTAPLLGLGGCAALLLRDPPQLYVLTPKSTFPADLPKVAWQLSVQRPIATGGLDETRIALKRDPVTLAYFKGASWTAAAPDMVQTLLIESFEASGKIVAVGRDTIQFRPDYMLQPELREFQADYSRNPAVPDVIVRLNVKLIRLPDREIIASDGFESRFQAAADEMPRIVEAFDAALGKVLKEAVSWTLRAPPTRSRRRF